MRGSSWLARLAVLVWSAWLGLVGLMLVLLRLDVWHPPVLPIMALFALLAASALSLLVAGWWRLIRGPRRAQALAWLLMGLAPLGFVAGHAMYGLKVALSRQLDLKLPLRMVIPIGESVLELIAGFSYPERTIGERVVMISSPLPEEVAREQVAMMDRHIEAVESRLGRTSTRRAYWVRGPVLGLEGRAVHAVCLGSRPDEGPPDFDGLTHVDRHEIAHVVLSQFGTMDVEPPAVLIEGWADANSGMDRNVLVLRVVRA